MSRPETGAGPDEPAFAAPWEAQAFALKAHLVATGRLDATRFSELLGEEMRNDPAPADAGTGYFVAFVTALERALVDLAPGTALEAERQAWHRAAAATPHGEPIELRRGNGE